MTLWNLLEGHLLLIASYFLALVSLIHMLGHRRSPGSTMAWLVVLVLLPFVGTALYLTFGGRKLRIDKVHRRHAMDQREPSDVTQAAGTLTPYFSQTATALGAFAIVPDNRVALHQAGPEAYAALCNVIDQAHSRLCLQTYIFAADDTGSEILMRLAKKAAAGVQVYVLVDGLGSLRTPSNFYQPLIDSGGQLQTFKPVWHLPFRSQTNLRNHRKIAVADGLHSFSGGINITRKEITTAAQQADWDDIAISITGPAAADLQRVFDSDWRYASDEQSPPLSSCNSQGLAPDQLANARMEASTQTGIDCNLGRVQILPSGPEMPLDGLYAATLTAIYQASERIWIATPYFVPDDALVDALKFASLRGIDVRILVPEKSNHWFSDIAAGALLRELAESGVGVYRFQPRMLHAKAMLVDHTVAAVGSANFDMRSLFLNYEIVQFLYAADDIQQLHAWFETKFIESEFGIPTPTVARSVSEGIARAFSPMF